MDLVEACFPLWRLEDFGSYKIIYSAQTPASSDIFIEAEMPYCRFASSPDLLSDVILVIVDRKLVDVEPAQLVQYRLAPLFSVLRTQAAPHVEILALRHRIGVLQRSAGKRSRGASPVSLTAIASDEPDGLSPVPQEICSYLSCFERGSNLRCAQSAQPSLNVTDFAQTEDSSAEAILRTVGLNAENRRLGRTSTEDSRRVDRWIF